MFENVFFGAPFGSEPSLFFNNYLFGLGFKACSMRLQHSFARMTDEGNLQFCKNYVTISYVVLAEL